MRMLFPSPATESFRDYLLALLILCNFYMNVSQVGRARGAQKRLPLDRRALLFRWGLAFHSLLASAALAVSILLRERECFIWLLTTGLLWSMGSSLLGLNLLGEKRGVFLQLCPSILLAFIECYLRSQ